MKLQLKQAFDEIYNIDKNKSKNRINELQKEKNNLEFLMLKNRNEMTKLEKEYRSEGKRLSSVDKITNQLDMELQYSGFPLFSIFNYLKEYIEKNKIKVISLKHESSSLGMIIEIHLSSDLLNFKLKNLKVFNIDIIYKDNKYFVYRRNQITVKASSRVFDLDGLIKYLEKVMNHRKTIIKTSLISLVSNIQ